MSRCWHSRSHYGWVKEPWPSNAYFSQYKTNKRDVTCLSPGEAFSQEQMLIANQHGRRFRSSSLTWTPKGRSPVARATHFLVQSSVVANFLSHRSQYAVVSCQKARRITSASWISAHFIRRPSDFLTMWFGDFDMFVLGKKCCWTTLCEAAV